MHTGRPPAATARDAGDAARRTAAVVVVGSYNQDYAWRVDRVPGAGETRRGGDFRSSAGGKGFNQAVACARQGVPTAFLGARGDDEAGASAARLAEREGLGGAWQVRADAATGSAAILVEAGGQNRIVVALGANERLDPDFLAAQEAVFAGADVVLVQLENNLDATRAALELGTRHGLLRLVNPAPMRADFDPALLGLCDVLTPNETEFAELLARDGGARVDAAAVAALGDEALHALARRLGVGSVVITLGAGGCFVSHAEAARARRGDASPCYRLAAEPVRPLDTTGAGDAFSGALAAALAQAGARPLRAAVQYANRVAALSTERAGAVPAMPYEDEVRARFGAAE